MQILSMKMNAQHSYMLPNGCLESENTIGSWNLPN